MIDIKKLEGVIPDIVLNQIPDVITKFEINTELRLSHFLSQCYHESNGFRVVKEKLNYSAEGLKKVFGKYFPGELANYYARQPDKIGSRVYASRMGNGNEESREGYKYCGRGFLQCTGKSNYESLSRYFGVDFINNPDLLATQYPLASAGWFFKKNNILIICDIGSDLATVEKVTKIVNGGLIGIDNRWIEFKKIYNKLK
jgi:putative chitinase